MPIRITLKFGRDVVIGASDASPVTILLTPSSERPHVRQKAVPSLNCFPHLGQYKFSVIVLNYEVSGKKVRFMRPKRKVEKVKSEKGEK